MHGGACGRLIMISQAAREFTAAASEYAFLDARRHTQVESATADAESIYAE